MGELAVSAVAGDVLVSLGLGSCIGLALLDRRVGVAGLAHVVLPASRRARDAASPCKFADTAVPELVDRARARSARAAPVLEAVLVGGASMFAVRERRRSRSARATRPPCASSSRACASPSSAAETGGRRGRTSASRRQRPRDRRARPAAPSSSSYAGWRPEVAA